MTDATPTTRPISDLVPHPDQHRIFGHVSPRELDALTDDISRTGLREPVEIDSHGVIISGHQRVRACQQLGYQDIPVVVVDVTEAERDERFVRANLTRRQLTLVDRARAAAELARIESSHRSGGKFTGRARDAIAAELGCSGRTVARYLRLLRLPRALQDAVGQDRLAMAKALQVESLPDSDLRNITEQILAGGDPREIVAAALASEPKPEPDTKDIYIRVLDCLRRDVPRLADHDDLAHRTDRPTDRLDILSDARDWLDEMIQAERDEAASRKERFHERLKRYPHVVLAAPEPADDDLAADDDTPAPSVAELAARQPGPQALAALAEADAHAAAEEANRGSPFSSPRRSRCSPTVPSRSL